MLIVPTNNKGNRVSKKVALCIEIHFSVQNLKKYQGSKKRHTYIFARISLVDMSKESLASIF